MGYYIEDYYLTTTVDLNSIVTGPTGVKTMAIEGSGNNTQKYKIPIVTISAPTQKVTLELTSVDNFNNEQLKKEDYYYKIQEQVVKPGNIFDITLQAGQTINIYDLDGNIKGAIEVRQIQDEMLEPVLNLVYLETLPEGMTLQGVIADLNKIYNTMRVNWKDGKTLKINIKEYIDNNGKIYFEKIRNAIPDFTEKEYYMIVLKPDDSNKGDFNNGAGGKSQEIGGNCFVQICKQDISIPPHELGHCAGLDEFVYDLGITTKEKTPQLVLLSFPEQVNNTNVMGYNSKTFKDLPHIDFFSWQIQIIRKNIRNRINQK